MTGESRRNAVVNATGNPLEALTDRQRLFVDALMRGDTQTNAARKAGYSAPGVDGYRNMKIPAVQDAVRYLHKKHEKKADMSRKKVMDGFLEAIEMAKLQGESGVMVNGWREIGRMCGYYAPETKKIDINITAKRVIDKLETLSDTELAEMIEDSAAIIEGEATEVLDTLQAADDASYEAEFEGEDD